MLTDCLPIKKVAEPNSNQMELRLGCASQDVPRRVQAVFSLGKPKTVQTHDSLQYLRAKKALSLLQGPGVWLKAFRCITSKALAHTAGFYWSTP